MINASIPTSATVERSHLIGLAAVCIAVAAAILPYLMLGSLRLYILIYPAVAGALAVALYAISRPVYVSFSIWMWFLTPLVRRLIDYWTGTYTDMSLILTAPYVVGGVGVLGLWTVLAEESWGFRQAFALPLIAFTYAFAVGAVQNSAQRVTMDGLEWFIPIILGALILADWRQYPRYRDVLLRTISVGMGVLGLYGVYQFFVLPPWDLMWMQESGMINLGLPRPMQIHVWGTMNSPNPYSVTMAVGLLGLLAGGIRSRADAIVARLAAVPAVLALALSQVRTGWGAFVIGLFCIVLMTQSRNRWRVLLFVGLIVAAALPVLLMDPVTSVLSSRADTIVNLRDNGSFNHRVEIYSAALPAIMRNPVGWGFGNPYPVDSGLLRIPLTLGWGGTVLYFLALGIVFLWIWRTRRLWQDRDPFIPVATGMAIAIVSVLPLGTAFEEMFAVFLWTFLMSAVAGIRYHYATADRPLYAAAPGQAAPPERVPEQVPG